ncbi:50S ribosomal protein L17 [Dethiobacter alkaliphilus]|uniref:Large ribosomal subunit protein bL17 n=1 Tax=Dethiobacter alkaliphilus AHT 1 TaxID=555088 RepID=C0GG85_DETAL|nr:50S ribosomal protein L17 [Dethiobacter alkaliphilus]EEG77774.1 ribosomal protein L17 [Dethiobacter alkaliphilus AHT 1]MCW3491112.1 50S ribosomal protein L17 [Dethiobacter alkaliphilus]
MVLRKFGRRSDHRRAMLRNLVTSMILAEKIETTEAKAKQIRSITEKMITLGKRGDLHAKRQAMSYMLDETAVKKLFDEIAPRYEERQGGYTRILKLGPRRGDAAPMAILELV